MKRFAAIVGPTPPHVRWSLLYSCPLRPRASNDAPLLVFRHLRSLQELARAYHEGRVFEGIAWRARPARLGPHDADRLADPPMEPTATLPRGFIAQEVIDAYGGMALVSACCVGCPANTLTGPYGWGGCFGCLLAQPIDPGAQTTSFFDWCDADGNADLWDRWQSSGQHMTRPRWYSLWIKTPVPPPALDALAQIVARALHEGKMDATTSSDLHSLATAINLCRSGNLSLCVKSIPAGFSDGTNWQLPSHCGHCRAPRHSHSVICETCGFRAPVEPARRRRVLGDRPYLDMTAVWGEAAARAAFDRYAAQHR